MKVIEFMMNVPEDRIVTLTLPEYITPGEHMTVMAVEQEASRQSLEMEAFLEGVKTTAFEDQEDEDFERRELFRTLERRRQIQLWDNVVLLEEMTAADSMTGELLLLPRGQSGRVTLRYNSKESEVEFGTRGREIFAKLRIPNDKLLIVFFDFPEEET